MYVYRVREYIKTKYPSIQNDTDFIEGCLEFLDLFITTYESSNSWNDVSTWSNYHALGGNQDLSWHTYGYKTLFEILLVSKIIGEIVKISRKMVFVPIFRFASSNLFIIILEVKLT